MTNKDQYSPLFNLGDDALKAIGDKLKSETVQPSVPVKHTHKEAFCHMLYESKDPKKRISVSIWNSRDGVTPFCFQSQEFGVELQHTHFVRDLYSPNYKPKPGDLIWRDATQEDKEKWFEQHKDMLRSCEEPNLKDQAENMLKSYEENPQLFFDGIDDGAPVLDLWKEGGVFL